MVSNEAFSNPEKRDKALYSYTKILDRDQLVLLVLVLAVFLISLIQSVNRPVDACAIVIKCSESLFPYEI